MMDYSFYGLGQVYNACEIYPDLLQLPDLIQYVSYLHGCCNDFWLLIKLFPLSFGEPSTIGELTILALIKKIV